MFNLRDFIFKGLKAAVGKMADYQIILNAVGWLEKGVLTEDDLAELNTLIDSQYIADKPIADEVPDEITEETVAPDAEGETIVDENTGETVAVETEETTVEESE